MNEPYSLFNKSYKYYIVPSTEIPLRDLPFHNSYLLFWFRYNAEIVLHAMNSAWREGYRFNDFEKG